MPRPRRQLSTQTRELLDRASQQQLAADHALQRRDELAIAAAKAGATWREVGAATAMSAQAAHQRYRQRLDG